MNPLKNKLEELEKVLFAARRGEDEITVGEDWQQSVMNDVRAMGEPAEAGLSFEMLGRFAWRFSTAALLAALILLIYVYATGFINYQELAMHFIEDPLSCIL